MRVRFKKFGVILLMLSLCAALAGCSSKVEVKVVPNAPTSTSEEPISLETLKSIPKFKSLDIKGNEVSDEIFKDSKLTLVNLWGTWCGPCVAELPELGELYVEVKDKGVNVVGVVEDGTNNEETVKKILKACKVSFTNIVPDEKFYDDFMSLCGTFPTSLLVDQNGNVVGEVISGARTKEEYLKLIEEALKKAN